VQGACIIHQLGAKCPKTACGECDRKESATFDGGRQSERQKCGHICSPYDKENDSEGIRVITDSDRSLWPLIKNVPWVAVRSEFRHWKEWDWTGFHICDHAANVCRSYPGNVGLLQDRKAVSAAQPKGSAGFIAHCDSSRDDKHSKKTKNDRKTNTKLMPGGPFDCGAFGTRTLCKNCKTAFGRGNADERRQMFPVSSTMDIPIASALVFKPI